MIWLMVFPFGGIGFVGNCFSIMTLYNLFPALSAASSSKSRPVEKTQSLAGAVLSEGVLEPLCWIAFVMNGSLHQVECAKRGFRSKEKHLTVGSMIVRLQSSVSDLAGHGLSQL